MQNGVNAADSVGCAHEPADAVQVPTTITPPTSCNANYATRTPFCTPEMPSMLPLDGDMSRLPRFRLD